MLRGLTTVRFHTTDLAVAKRWYTELLGIEPYFDRPEYAEFRLGDYQHELGLLDSSYVQDLGRPDSSATGPACAVVYWKLLWSVKSYSTASVEVRMVGTARR